MRPTVRKFTTTCLLFAGLVANLSHADTHATEIGSTEKAAERSAPPNVIFDTDMKGDIDDAMALAIMHALHDRGEINLVAVTVSTEDKWSASYVDLVNTFYRHPQIPVGMVRGGIDTEALRKMCSCAPSNYTELLAGRRKNDGSLVYPHRLVDGTKASEAVSILRKTLAAQPDGSVVIVQVGYSTNLARLLDTGADVSCTLNGRDLIKRKVRLLSVMAGTFAEYRFFGTTLPKGSPEFNLMADVPSAQKLFSQWPTPIVASGAEIGLGMLYPAHSIEHDYGYVENHPIAEAYRTFSLRSTDASGREIISFAWPYDYPTWDLTAALYAARPDRNYFSLSKPGRITVLPDGGSRFDEAEDGTHRYLILDEEQKARTLEAMVMLVSQPPKGK